ncbi:MAG TPA: hypothetical protein VK604_08425 [Bryobacteraceae bacterium]|nr:hypothetical protein [Bryobacteraceae bacterium]
MMRERLAEYGATTVLVALSQIAGIAKTWNNDIDSDGDLKLIKELLPTHRRTIERFRTSNHVLFTRISLLYVSQQACEVCSDDAVAPKPLEPHDFERIFETCLMANDLIARAHVLPNDTTIDKAAKLLPLANYVPYGTYPRDLARNLVILEEIAPLLKAAKNYRDIAPLFTEATGVSPHAFCELAFCAGIKYLASERHSRDSFILRPLNLAHDNVPKEDINAFFDRSSISIKDLLTLVRSSRVDPADFIVFQRYPLIQAGPEAYVS